MALLQRLFGNRARVAVPARAPLSNTARFAAQLLRSPTALVQLSEADASTVVGFMRLQRYACGEAIVRQGEHSSGDAGFMALVVKGEVTVESLQPSRAQPLTVNVLGTGSLFGEVSLLDGEVRSATCTASTDTTCALLTRDALQALLAEEPATAAKLMVAVGERLSQRLREIDAKFQMCHQLVASMQQEIDRITQGD